MEETALQRAEKKVLLRINEFTFAQKLYFIWRFGRIQFSFLKIFIGVQLLYNAVLVSAITAKWISHQFGHSVASDSLGPHGLQHAKPPLSITNSQSLPKLMSIELVMPAISSSVIPFSCLQSSQDQGLFLWVCSSLLAVNVLGLQLQHQSFQWISRTDFL